MLVTPEEVTAARVTLQAAVDRVKDNLSEMLEDGEASDSGWARIFARAQEVRIALGEIENLYLKELTSNGN